MKITARQYAEILLESLSGKNREEAAEVIGKFSALLAKNGDLGLSEKIIEEFGKFWDKKEGILGAEATTVSEMGSDVSHAIAAYVKKETGAKTVTVDNKIDKKILGGVVIKYGDKILDMSTKRKLEDFKNQIVK